PRFLPGDQVPVYVGDQPAKQQNRLNRVGETASMHHRRFGQRLFSNFFSPGLSACGEVPARLPVSHYGAALILRQSESARDVRALSRLPEMLISLRVEQTARSGVLPRSTRLELLNKTQFRLYQTRGTLMRKQFTLAM